MITAKTGEFLILKTTNNKNILVKVTKDGVQKRALLCGKEEYDNNQINYVSFDDSDIVANLGANPTFGKAYGLEIEIFHKHVKDPIFGDIFFFRRLDSNDEKRLMKAFDYVGTKLKKLKIFPEHPIDNYVKESRGKYAGCYKHKIKADTHDELLLFPKSFDQCRYYIAHEVSHGIWWHGLDDVDKSRWIKAYSKNITLSKVTSDYLNDMRENLINTGRVSLFNKELSDDAKEVFKEIKAYIFKKHCLDGFNLNTLIAEDDDLTTYWPSPVVVSHKKVLISEYSLKNVYEFMAESFAYWLTGKKVPKSIESLIESTITRIRAKNAPIKSKSKKAA